MHLGLVWITTTDNEHIKINPEMIESVTKQDFITGIRMSSGVEYEIDQRRNISALNTLGF